MNSVTQNLSSESEVYRLTVRNPTCLKFVCQRHKLATEADDQLTQRAEKLTNLHGKKEEVLNMDMKKISFFN